MAASIPTAFETGNDTDIILKQEADSVPPPEKKLKTDMTSDVDHPDMKTKPDPLDYVVEDLDYVVESSSDEDEEDEDKYRLSSRYDPLDYVVEDLDYDPLDYVVESSSDEDEEYEDKYHDMTKEEAEFYYKQLRESDGFDVDGLPYVYAVGLIQPADLTNHPEDYERYTKLAIENYNQNNEPPKIEFVRVVKANLQAACPLNYYITFEAKNVVDGQIKTYQAKVDSAVLDEYTEVDFVRLKPGSN